MELRHKEKTLQTMEVSEKLSEPTKITLELTARRSDCLDWNVTLLSKCFFSPMPMFGARIKLRKALNVEFSLVFIVLDDIV
jgi:hypothetical protein